MISLNWQPEQLEAQVQILSSKMLYLKAEMNPLKATIQWFEQQIEQERPPGHAVALTFGPVWPKVGHFGAKKNMWASSGLLIANAPPDSLLRYPHAAEGDVLLDHLEQVVGHGNHVALLSDK